MKLGLSSHSYGWTAGVPGHYPKVMLDAFGLLEKAMQYNVKLIQIADNMPLHLLKDDEFSRLLRQADQYGIDIEVGTRGLTKENIECYIDIAKECNSGIIRIVIDNKDYKPSVPEVISVLDDTLPSLRKAGVVLAIENHDRFLAKDLVHIIKSTDKQCIGICLDTVNSIGAAEGTEYIVDTLAPYTVNLHIKDFEIKRVFHLMGFTVLGTPAGEGMLQVPWLIDRIKSVNPDINAILELWTPPEQDIEDTVLKEDKWVYKSVKHLRQFIKD